jgi:hypothetical protein
MVEAVSVLTPESLFALLRSVSGVAGRPDEEHPRKPGPADPVIRAAYDRVGVFGPSPEPWRILLAWIIRLHPEIGEGIGGGPGAPVHIPSMHRMALMHAIGDALVKRAEVIQDVNDATGGKAEQRGIIIVSGYVERTVEELCRKGFNLCWPEEDRFRDPIKWPYSFPIPFPHPPEFDRTLSGVDLVGIAMALDRGAKLASSGQLQAALEAGAKKLLNEGTARSGP